MDKPTSTENFVTFTAHAKLMRVITISVNNLMNMSIRSIGRLLHTQVLCQVFSTSRTRDNGSPDTVFVYVNEGLFIYLLIYLFV